MPHRKGRPKTPGSGRKKGIPNKVTESIKRLMLETIFPEARIISEFEFFLTHPDPHLRWKAVELGLAYGFGKPIMPIQPAEDAPLLEVNVSAIPKVHERVN